MRQSYWSQVWQQYRRSNLAMIALALVVFLFAVALTAQWIAPYAPDAYDLDQILVPPGHAHWLGTDDIGRDVLTRIIYGSRVSLTVGFVAVGIYVLIGIFLGALAGFYGGVVDMVISRMIEVMLCFPTFFLILAILAFVGPSIYNIMIVIGLTQWTGIARLVRGEFLKFREREFVQAARLQGAGDWRIIFLHLLPNSLAPILVSASFGVAGAILTESSLSFLGFGVPPQTPSWGGILSQAQGFMDVAWWLTLAPGFAIFLTITAYNLVGEALRDAIDPRLKNVL
ncbi:MAG: ABC transporter permease [Deltaproteobacteria bacterium]|nr:ABC transporter permease [Deltaproteobacteria bacterium]